VPWPRCSSLSFFGGHPEQDGETHGRALNRVVNAVRRLTPRFLTYWWDRHPACHSLIDRRDACPTKALNAAPNLRNRVFVFRVKPRLLLETDVPFPCIRANGNHDLVGT
jgi:hypothetical protein